MSTRTCTYCGATVPSGEYCAACVTTLPQRAPAHTLTPDQREAEFRGLRVLEVPIDLVKDRMEALLGRPVRTHELDASRWDGLCQEARWEGPPPTLQETLSNIPPEKLLRLPVPDEE